MLILPERDEHSLLLVKPGARQQEVAAEVGRQLSALGLSIAAEASRFLTASEVVTHFKYTAPSYLRMWTAGETRALLVRGAYAPELAQGLKATVRRALAVDQRDVYNLIHHCDTGWEFVHQFQLFFPSLELERHAGYADLLIALDVEGPNCEDRLAQAIRSSSVAVVGLRVRDVRDPRVARLAALLPDQPVLMALEQAVTSGAVRLTVLALFAPGAAPANRPPADAREFIRWAHGERGLVFLGQNDKLIPGCPTPADFPQFEQIGSALADQYDQLLAPLLREGLDGVLVVEPSRSAFQLEVLWDVADRHSLLYVGGSLGQAPACSYAIDRRDVERIRDALLHRG